MAWAPSVAHVLGRWSRDCGKFGDQAVWERRHHVGSAPGRHVGPKRQALHLGNLRPRRGERRLSRRTLTLKLQPTLPVHLSKGISRTAARQLGCPTG